jgi:hypothetical protein
MMNLNFNRNVLNHGCNQQALQGLTLIDKLGEHSQPFVNLIEALES